MADTSPIVIVDAIRTPMGGLQGELSSVAATTLGAHCIAALVEAGSLAADAVDEVLMGCVLPAGLGQAPARQAARAAGLADGTACTTINKMCGSGMQATMLAHDMICAGSADTAIAGGFESMSNAPYLLPGARRGMRLGHGAVQDHLFLDGLEDAYDKGRLMGWFAEQTATHYGFTREGQDAFAVRSLSRANAAIASGVFAREITPVAIATKDGERRVEQDEQPPKARIERIPTLRPAFADDGTVTAANSSSISDGAAALLLMREDEAERRGLTPRARILGHRSAAHSPQWFTTAPVQAITRLLERLNLRVADIDLFEINEAFAVVTLAAIRELALPDERVNVHGGACALGHPIGASGARIIVTLLNALERHAMRTGVAALCIGGGEATAIAIERIH